MLERPPGVVQRLADLKEEMLEAAAERAAQRSC